MTWNPDDLQKLTDAEELDLSSNRPDGTARPFVTMWSVVVDGDLYVRSAYGPDNGWYRRALASGSGAIRSGGVTADATFADGTDADAAALDAEYHRKYDRFGAKIVNTVVGEAAHAVTMRISPV